MIIIPAIDIKNRKCVRLSQGRAEAQTVYSDDPAAMARHWVSQGAKRLHVVDLDGAFEKSPQNLPAIENILKAVDIPVQVGGGIRDIPTMQLYLDMGVDRVIVGTVAVKEPDMVKEAVERFPGRVVLGVDAKDGLVAVNGWVETTTVTAADLVAQFEGLPVAAIHFTDIYRDGMRTGVNIEQTKALAQSTKIDVIASGGVATLDDILALKPLEPYGVVGVITGKALYEKTLDLKKAIAAAQ